MTQTKFDVDVQLVGGGAILDAIKELAKEGKDRKPDAPGAASGGSNGDAALKKESEKQTDELEGLSGFMARLGKTLGIQVGLSSILKQSQIFTGTIGSIFQIFGALVDVILAPFLPIIVPAIRFLAGLIPVIHSTIQKIFDWIKEKMPSKEAFNSTISGWGANIIDSLFFLPEDMREKMKNWWASTDHMAWMKKAAIGTIVALALGKMGLFKALTGMLTRIPIVGPMFAKLSASLSGMFGKVLASINPFKALKVVPGKGMLTSGGSHIAGKIGGMLGGLKGLGGKALGKVGLGGRVGGMLTGGLGKVGGKAALGKLIPGLGAVITAGQGITAAVITFKESEGSFASRLGKASLVGGVGVGMGALSLAPGMSLVAPIVGGIAVEMLKSKFTQPIEIKQTIVGANGETIAENTMRKDKEEAEFTNKGNAANAGIVFGTGYPQ